MKLKVKSPIVEINGDEMAKVIWEMIKEKIILPNLDIKLIYFDLSLENRDFTDDQVTIDAANAIKQYGTGIKCATITPDIKRLKSSMNLKKKYPSPSATIRKAINGTIFREPIVYNNIPKFIRNWNKSIIIARHAYGDQYQATDISIDQPGTLALTFTPEDPTLQTKIYDVNKFESGGVAMTMYNINSSIESFARSCFYYAYSVRYPLFLSTKNTILSIYDERFVEIFFKIYEQEFKRIFSETGIYFEHRLIDDMAAYSIKSNGGFVWACKNYDGDVQSDIIAQAFGSIGSMTSILLNPSGNIAVTEAAHGTIARHYKLHLQGHKTSSNPVSLIYAWSRALKHRAQIDKTPDITEFANKIEYSCTKAIESGYMTKDLSSNISQDHPWLTTEDFFNKVIDNLHD